MPDVLDRAIARLAGAGLSMQPRLTPYIPHEPHPKQAAFLSPLVTQIREVLYGGAAGGGKSDALLMAALQYVDVAGYSALLLRKTYSDLALPGALMNRADAWLAPSDAHWQDTTHTWTFPSGATVTFGYLDHVGSEDRYASSEFQFIGFDEVTQFSEKAYRFLFSRLRRLEGAEVPLRMRAATNPVGPGKQWVSQRFIQAGPSHGRLFIPSRLEDNPSLDAADYERSLKELGPVLYRQLRYGDWDVKPEGNMFKRAWFFVVPRNEVPTDVQRVRRWDLAATETPKGKEARAQDDADWTVGLRMARSPSGMYFVEDVARARTSPSDTEKLVAAVASQDGRDVPIRMEQEGGASGKSLISHYRRNVLDGYDFRGRPSSGSKETRANPVAARAEAGEVVLVDGPWIEDFLDEVTAFPEGLHDDQVDALSGAFTDLARAGEGIAGREPQSFTAGSHWLNG